MLFKGFQGSSLKDNCKELQNKQAPLARGGNSNACNSGCCNNLPGCGTSLCSVHYMHSQMLKIYNFYQ